MLNRLTIEWLEPVCQVSEQAFQVRNHIHWLPRAYYAHYLESALRFRPLKRILQVYTSFLQVQNTKPRQVHRPEYQAMFQYCFSATLTFASSFHRRSLIIYYLFPAKHTLIQLQSARICITLPWFHLYFLKLAYLLHPPKLMYQNNYLLQGTKVATFTFAYVFT